MGASGGPKINNNGLVLVVDPKDDVSNPKNSAFIRNLADRKPNPSSTVNADIAGINLSGSAMSGLGVRFGSGSKASIHVTGSNSRFVATNTTHNTINMWIKKEKDPSQYTTFQAGLMRICNRGPFHMGFTNSGFFCHTLAADGTFETNTPNTSDIVTPFTWSGSYHMLTVTRDTSAQNRIQVFVDGDLQTQTSFSSVNNKTMDMPGPGQGGFEISNESEAFDGEIYDVRIYDAELTAAQIKEIYVKPNQALPTGISGSQLWGWWPLGEGIAGGGLQTNTNLHDTCYNHGTSAEQGMPTGSFSTSGINPTRVSQSAFVPQYVNQNHSVKLDTAEGGNYVDLGTDSALVTPGNKVSMSVWIFFRNAGLVNSFILMAGSNQTVSPYSLKINNYASPTFTVDTSGGDTGTGETFDIEPHRWYNIVGVYDNSTIKIYVNGVEKRSVSVSNNGDVVHDGSTSFKIGNQNAFGIIDELAIYNDDLSVAEVQSLYQTSSYGSPLPPDASTINSDNLIGYWRNNGNETWTDLSGNGNHGTVNQQLSDNNSLAVYRFREGVVPGRDYNGYPLNRVQDGWFNHMSGSDVLANYNIAVHDTVQVGDVDHGNAFTMEAWIYPKGIPSNAYIFFKPHDSPHYGFWPTIAMSIYAPGGYIRAIYSRPGYGGFLGYHDTTGGCIDGVNKWYHIAATKNENTGSGGIKIYKNGVRQPSTGSYVYPNLDSDLNTIENVNTPIFLNGSPDSSRRPLYQDPFFGRITSQKLYDKELSEKEIQENFRNMKSRFDL
jgi:hypothetical protein